MQNSKILFFPDAAESGQIPTNWSFVEVPASPDEPAPASEPTETPQTETPAPEAPAETPPSPQPTEPPAQEDFTSYTGQKLNLANVAPEVRAFIERQEQIGRTFQGGHDKYMALADRKLNEPQRAAQPAPQQQAQPQEISENDIETAYSEAIDPDTGAIINREAFRKARQFEHNRALQQAEKAELQRWGNAYKSGLLMTPEAQQIVAEHQENRRIYSDGEGVIRSAKEEGLDPAIVGRAYNAELNRAYKATGNVGLAEAFDAARIAIEEGKKARGIPKIDTPASQGAETNRHSAPAPRAATMPSGTVTPGALAQPKTAPPEPVASSYLDVVMQRYAAAQGR